MADKTEEKKCEKLDNFTILRDRVPDHLKEYLEPLSRELEDVCAQVTADVHAYFAQPNNKYSYGLLVAKTMEFVEDYKDLKNSEKKVVATRCILEDIDSLSQMEKKKEEEDVKEEDKAGARSINLQFNTAFDLIGMGVSIAIDLMTTIPGTIEAMIGLTRERKDLNRPVTTSGIVEHAYIRDRTFVQTVEYIRVQGYTIHDMMVDTYVIGSQIMYFVGGYPTLSGPQKKEITIQVFNKIFIEYRSAEGEAFPPQFVHTTVNFLPEMVDTMVRVSVGNFHINADVTGCVRALLSRCKVSCTSSSRRR